MGVDRRSPELRDHKSRGLDKDKEKRGRSRSREHRDSSSSKKDGRDSSRSKQKRSSRSRSRERRDSSSRKKDGSDTSGSKQKRKSSRSRSPKDRKDKKIKTEEEREEERKKNEEGPKQKENKEPPSLEPSPSKLKVEEPHSKKLHSSKFLAATLKNIYETYEAVEGSEFECFDLKEEIMKSVLDCGLEYVTEVQHQCIAEALLGTDVIVQGSSGTGKATLLVLATLQQIVPGDGQVSVLVMCQTRQLAFRISKKYKLFLKHMPNIQIATFIGLTSKEKNPIDLQNSPHIAVGTPSRILALVRSKQLNLQHLKHFVLYDCDKLVGIESARREIQEIFDSAPDKMQVMMFSLSLREEVRPLCKNFTKNPLEVYDNDEYNVLKDNVLQYYMKLSDDNEKNEKLVEILRLCTEKRVIIFVRSIVRSIALTHLLHQKNFPVINIHANMREEKRMHISRQFKDFEKKILIACRRGIDIDRVNIIFNYDMPHRPGAYLYQVARAAEYGTKGMALTFISDLNDTKILDEVQDRFDKTIIEVSKESDLSCYFKD